MAKQFDISILLKVINKATKPLTKIDTGLKKVDKSTSKLNKSMKKLGDQTVKVGKSFKKVGSSLSLKLTAPLLGAGLMALKSSADIETMGVAFESMLGSAEKASKVVKDLVDFTAKTPFQLEGVGKAGKQLLAFGVAEEDLIPRLKVLGDIAAGTNAPLSDIAQIFGKIKAKNKAMTEEILQLSDRGIPIIKMLSEEYGITGEQVLKAAEKSKLSFDVIFKAMTKMSNKGGIFENQMEKQSNTMAGIFSTLKDNIVIAFATIGDELDKQFKIKEAMKGLIVTIQEMTKAFIAFSKAHPGIMKVIFALTTFLAVLGPILATVGLFITSIGAIVSGLGSVAIVLGTTAGALAIFIGAFAAAAAGMVAIITLITLIIKDFRIFKELVKDLWDKAGLLAFLTPLTAMIKTVELLIKGSQKLKRVISGEKSPEEVAQERQQTGLANLAKLVQQRQAAQGTESKILIEVKGKDGATADVKNVKGSAPVAVSNEALVGAL